MQNIGVQRGFKKEIRTAELGRVKTFERAKAIERTFRKPSPRCTEIRKQV